MRASVRRVGGPKARVPQTILGQNLDLIGDTVAGLLSDRLDNAKFAGPADETGVARGWKPVGLHYAAFKAEVVSGMSLSGHESQWLHCYNAGVAHAAIHQPGRSVRAGEKFEVEIWAKTAHQPVTLLFHLTSSELRRREYSSARIVVDASYWKRYCVELEAPEDEDEAFFSCILEEGGVVWIDQIHMRPKGEGPLCRKLIERMATMRIPVLRMPGGCTSTNYHWKHGIGPIHLRQAMHDPTNHLLTHYDFGTDEYLEICLAQGIMPHITVNIGSGTPDEAGEWAAYIAKWYRDRGVEPSLAYFQMGNEQYGLWESSHMNGAMYVSAMREFIPAVRDNYPHCRIVALAEKWAQGLDQSRRSAWREAVLEVVRELDINVLVLNRYKGQWCANDLDRQINVVESVTKIKNDIDELIQDCRSRGLTNTVGITEWNYWLHARHTEKGPLRFYEPNDAQHCLFAAGVLNMFARLAPDFELGNFFQLLNAMGIFIHRNADVIESPMADVFRLYRPAFPGQLLPLEIDSPRLGEHESAIDGLCIKQEESTWIFLANRHPTLSASVELPDGLGAIKEMAGMVAGSPTEFMRPMESTPPREKKIVLPPLSILRLHC
ncbi:MAG: hypothetical protein IT447_10245 [Phycisphaerales bacterium]|nr:hypothetical protein [Phycisphaerales bacterium]